MEDIIKLSVRQLSDALQKKELSAREAAQAYIKQIKQSDESVQAYLTLCEQDALKTADQIDLKRIKGEELPPLAGILAGIKDNICTKGVQTTCASKMLENFIPPYDATVMEKLNAQQIITLGKLNMDEFAMGSTTENSHFKITHNPHNLEYVPGGSSGGSAAAVAANEAAFTLGSDTGGSIRQPAAFCGVVGMKPTYGTVSRFGLVAFASSLDQIGPLTKTVEDSALVLQAITGHDPKDATSVKTSGCFFDSVLKKGVKGLKIALPVEYFASGLNDEIKNCVLGAAKKLEELGAELIEVSVPTLAYALPAYYVISSAEASSNLSRFDGVKYGYRTENYENLADLYLHSRSEGFGAEVKRRIMLGSFALSAGYYDAYYKKALQVRTLLVREFDRIFETCPVILSPVTPTVAYKIGEKCASPLEMYLGDIYTVPANIAGLPALSMPCGINGEGLPVGLQLMGKPFGEADLYRAAYALEQILDMEV